MERKRRVQSPCYYAIKLRPPFSLSAQKRGGKRNLFREGGKGEKEKRGRLRFHPVQRIRRYGYVVRKKNLTLPLMPKRGEKERKEAA